MLLSMTGYGAGQLDCDGLTVGVEIRSVNNRFLKLQCRLTEGYAALEPRLEELVKRQIRRGAVQLNLEVRKSGTSDFVVNTEVIHSYLRQLRDIQIELKDSDHIPLSSVLALPGVVADRQSSADIDNDWPTIERAVNMALTDLQAMRTKEGAAMGEDLAAQTVEIARAAHQIKQLTPRVAEAYQTRLTERLNKLLEQHDVQVQPADVVREVGVFAERADISEEIVRLGSHLEQFEQFMLADDSAGSGKKLEFLVQELLRETNTIGSKASDAEIAKHVVHVKTCIERIREMVQNIE